MNEIEVLSSNNILNIFDDSMFQPTIRFSSIENSGSINDHSSEPFKKNDFSSSMNFIGPSEMIDHLLSKRN